MIDLCLESASAKVCGDADGIGDADDEGEPCDQRLDLRRRIRLAVDNNSYGFGQIRDPDQDLRRPIRKIALDAIVGEEHPIVPRAFGFSGPEAVTNVKRRRVVNGHIVLPHSCWLLSHNRVRGRPIDTRHDNISINSAAVATTRAYAALDLVHRDLKGAANMAASIVSTDPGEARAVALWTLGKVNYEQGDLPQARKCMRQAISVSRKYRLPRLEGAVLVSLAAVLVEIGRTADALRMLDQAQPLATGLEVGRLEQQRAFVLFHLGEWHQAVQACHVALPLIRAANDRVGEVRLLLSRGISYLGAGALHEAAADFIASRQLANEIGETILFALSEQDLGCVYGRMGDIPNALAAFDRARSGYQSHGGASRLLTILEADLAETLILAGLVTEAADAAQRSAEEAVTSGNVVNEAEARLIMARALLADGKLPAAEHAALAAAALFRRSRRPAWAAFARFVALQAQATLGETVARPKIVQDRAAKLARELAAHGWEAESLYARTFVGRLALQRGDIAGAQLELSLAAQMLSTWLTPRRLLHGCVLLNQNALIIFQIIFRRCLQFLSIP